MTETFSSQTSQTTSGGLAFVLRAEMLTEDLTWTSKEPPRYSVECTASSCSPVTDQVLKYETKRTQTSFARQMAAVYASLSSGQMRLGKEFETAIFEDLDSLYEA